jgi:LmbE family N-acetylglucosaminyl deacetylase
MGCNQRKCRGLESQELEICLPGERIYLRSSLERDYRVRAVPRRMFASNFCNSQLRRFGASHRMPTIVSLTPETEWISILRDITAWEPPCVPTLVLAPRPDDETLGAGGLIARLRKQDVSVSVAAITDGENAYSDMEGLDAIRVPEQIEALHRLGVPKSMIHRLALPDSDVSAHEDELVDLLLRLVEPETHVIAPWKRDFHPDHEAVGRAADRVAQLMGLSVTYYCFWAWHRGRPDILSGLQVMKLVLSDTELQTKLYALEAHISQLEHPDSQPILSSELLAPVRRSFEVYLR